MIFSSKDRENLENVTAQLDLIFRDIIDTYIKVGGIQDDVKQIRHDMASLVKDSEKLCKDSKRG